MSSGELAFINWLRGRTPASPRVLLGPGDDTAALAWPSRSECLVTTDMLLEGSCFLLEGSPIQVPGIAPASPRRVGRKAMAVNLSDLAAMAGIPVAAVISVGLPQRDGRRLAEELYLGLREMADAFDTAIIGGDTNSWKGPLVLSVTLLGEAGPGGIIRRAGARVGDVLMVTGPLGGSILGKHLDFTPRVREALTLAQEQDLHAMIDISDGLAADVAKLAAESQVGAVLWAECIPLAEAAYQCPDNRSPLEHALADGEDYELVFAVSAEQARQLEGASPCPGVKLTVIGECVEERGLWLQHQGKREPLEPLGWVHSLES